MAKMHIYFICEKDGGESDIATSCKLEFHGESGGPVNGAAAEAYYHTNVEAVTPPGKHKQELVSSSAKGRIARVVVDVYLPDDSSMSDSLAHLESSKGEWGWKYHGFAIKNQIIAGRVHHWSLLWSVCCFCQWSERRSSQLRQDMWCLYIRRGILPTTFMRQRGYSQKCVPVWSNMQQKRVRFPINMFWNIIWKRIRTPRWGIRSFIWISWYCGWQNGHFLMWHLR